MDIKDIKELLKLIKRYEIQDFTLQKGDDKIRIRMTQPAVPTEYAPVRPAVMPELAPVHVPSAPAGAAQAESQLSVGENQFLVTSPIVGTFYRSPSPESPAYVEVGGTVSNGTILCIVEAMKIMNEIECEVNGKISSILVENAQPVEYGEPLFIIDLS